MYGYSLRENQDPMEGDRPGSEAFTKLKLGPSLTPRLLGGRFTSERSRSNTLCGDIMFSGTLGGVFTLLNKRAAANVKCVRMWHVNVLRPVPSLGLSLQDRLCNVSGRVNGGLCRTILVDVRGALKWAFNGQRKSFVYPSARANCLFSFQRRLVNVRLDRVGIVRSKFCLQRVRGVIGRLGRGFNVNFSGANVLRRFFFVFCREGRVQRASGNV